MENAAQNMAPAARVIKVTVKNVYGNDHIYPLCEDAKRFTHLLAKKTLSKQDLAVIQDLGFEVEFVGYLPDMEA